MKSVALHNLGCKVNAYETDVMRQMLQEKGYVIVPFDETADIYIVNTCTVTNIADRKSRQMLHRARAKNPGAVVVAVGCYVQTGGEQLEKDGAVDLAVGNNRKKDLIPILESFLAERERAAAAGKTWRAACVPDMGREDTYEELSLRRSAERTRAYIKIQDGCNQFCSYCVIPYARGRVRSRKEADVLAETEGLVRAGYREVVLTGIHISSYGTDFGGEGGAFYDGRSRLPELVEKIHAIEGLDRIRLGSLEPRVLNAETARRFAQLPKVCPHFHLSLQSGCDETLKRMNRHYTTGEYYQCVENLRNVYGHPAVTTDVIVGFPGETEEEFGQTYAFLEKADLYEMHVFKYSRRKGTRAAAMEGQVSDAVKAARSERLIGLAGRQSVKFREAYIGAEAEVLYEEARKIDGKLYQTGHTAQYVKVARRTQEDLSNCLYRGRITGFLTDDVLLQS